MKKTLLLSGVLLAMTASVASAGGINLAWTDCLGLGGVVNRNFACNTNTGNNDMFISFEPIATIPDVNGSNPIIDLQSASAVLPAWWQFKNAGTCRLVSLAANSGVTGSCPDTWAGQGTAGIAAYFTNANVPAMATNRARILGSISVPGGAAAQVDPGTEYYCLMIRVTNAKTVGTGLCAGCLDPVCLVLNEVLLTSNNSGDNRLTNPITSNYVTWQGGVVSAPGCPGATPTINKTWGQVKSLYR